MPSLRSLILFTILALVWVTPKAKADYRVFQLAITDGRTGQSRVVISTLDHIQYPTYHPVNSTDTIAIQATWMCWGRSDWFKGYCPNPKAGTPPTASSAPAPL